ncbi:MAG: hypothetical protein K2I39_04400 [Muribaculaceae bacterium]|nr:hypothetical protein [Muribaculaceae bacterium]
MTDAGDLLKKVYETPEGSLDADGMEALGELRSRYPYFVAPALAELRQRGADAADAGAEELRRYLAVAASSGRALAFAAHGAEWRDFYPARQETEAKRTDDVIDIFLRTYGSCTPEENALLERMIFNPTPDYSEMLAREEQENLPEVPPETDSQDARIAAFILSQHPAARHEEEAEADTEADEEDSRPVARPEHSDDSLLSESLARIFIKQRRYERAYEIISGLSLKFPKKSAYFADQLRFLQKLIINQRRLEACEGDGSAKN